MAWESMLPIAGAVLGGLSSGNSQSTQTANRDPWGPTQGWLTNNLGLGQRLQDAYMANPLSALQQEAYANSFNNTNLGRSIAGRVIPQLSSTTFFDRSNPLNRPTPLSFVGGDMGGAGGSSGGSLGLGGGLMPTVSSAPTVSAVGPTIPQRVKGPQMAVDTNIFGGGGYNGDGGLNAGFPGAYADTTSDLSRAVAGLVNASPLSSIAGYLDGKASAAGINVPGMIDGSTVAKSPGMTEADLAGFIAGQRAVQEANKNASTTTVDTETDRGGAPGGLSGGYGGVDSGGYDGPGAGGYYAKGGLVKKSSLAGPNPSGPDEGSAHLQSGEYVVKKSAVKKYGKALLDDINSKRFTKKQGK